MPKKLLGLDEGGRLVLKLPDRDVQPVSGRRRSWAFLLIDCSGSMSGPRLREAKEGASAFAVDAGRKRYSVGLISFATTAQVLCRPEEDRAKLDSKIMNLVAGGSTNMADAIEIATLELNLHSGIRAIVLATDGVPGDENAALDAARRAKESGIDIIAIGTSDADRAFLQQLASRSDLAVMVIPSELKSGITEAVKMLPGSGT